VNKSEFIAAMEAQLLRLSKADRDDILNDYESHFVNGVAEGKTEEEVSAQLGDPVELAAVYMENLPAGAKGAPYIPPQEEPKAAPEAQPQYTYQNQYSAPQPEQAVPAAASKEPDPLGIVAVVLLSLFVALPVLWSIIGIIIGAFASTIGFGVAAVALIVLGITTAGYGTIAAVGMILLGVAMIALGVLAVSLGVLATKGTIWLVKWYIEMCKKLIGGAK